MQAQDKASSHEKVSCSQEVGLESGETNISWPGQQPRHGGQEAGHRAVWEAGVDQQVDHESLWEQRNFGQDI